MSQNSISLLGPANTYSDQALKKAQPGATPLYCDTIAAVFESVSKKRVKEGLVPLENSLSGSVRETLDALYEEPAVITGVVTLPIHLTLTGLPGATLKGIKTVYSHSQALLQCRRFLKTLKGARVVPVASTAQALERIERDGDKTQAAIGAPVTHLKALKTGVEDETHNVTTFARIALKPATKAGGGRTLIAFTFSKDRAGSLYEALGVFAGAGINLTKIESRPNRQVRGDYVFYVEFEGRGEKALKAVKGLTATLKVLGHY